MHRTTYDLLRLCETLQPTYVSIPVSGVLQLCGYNWRRVALIIGTNTTPAWISPDATLTAQPTNTTQQGIQIGGGSTLPLTVDIDTHLNACIAAWFGAVPGTANATIVTVIETVLRDIPGKEKRYYDALARIIRSRRNPNGSPQSDRVKYKPLWDKVLPADWYGSNPKQ